MKKLTKIGIAAVVALTAILVPVMTVAGWYPEREIREYTGPNTPGFDHVTFNSFYNVPDGPDGSARTNEQEFFDGNQVGSNTALDNINVKVGQELILRTYVHNGAAPALNDAAHNHAGIARNTKVKIGLPVGVGTKMNAVSQISADNAKPGSVFDTLDFTSMDGTPFKLSYVPGSAYGSTRSNAHIPLSDSIVGDGALIGETAADGNVPGCFQFTQWAYIKVKVEAAPLQIQKTVAFPKQAFVKQVDAQAGDRLYFKVDFKNAGNTTINGVALTDKLPAQLELIPGTVKLYNANFTEGTPLPDNALFTPGGQGVGDYGAGTNGYVLYQVKVKADARDKMTNVACVRSTVIPYDTCDNASVVPPTPPTPNPTPDPLPNPNPVPPVTPGSGGTLPATGLESGIGGIVGMSGLATATYAYRKSKKAVKGARAINKSR